MSSNMLYLGRVAAIAVLSVGALASPASSQTQPPEPLVAKAARELGVQQCLGGIQKASSGMLGTPNKQDIMLNWDRQSPDDSPFFSLTGALVGKQSSVLSLNAFPSGNGNCDIIAEQTWIAPESCKKIGQERLQKLPSSRLIDTITVYRNPTLPGETFTLVDATNNTCLIVRRLIDSTAAAPAVPPGPPTPTSPQNPAPANSVPNAPANSPAAPASPAPIPAPAQGMQPGAVP